MLQDISTRKKNNYIFNIHRHWKSLNVTQPPHLSQFFFSWGSIVRFWCLYFLSFIVTHNIIVIILHCLCIRRKLKIIIIFFYLGFTFVFFVASKPVSDLDKWWKVQGLHKEDNAQPERKCLLKLWYMFFWNTLLEMKETHTHSKVVVNDIFDYFLLLSTKKILKIPWPFIFGDCEWE